MAGDDAKLKIGVDAKQARREVRSLGNDVSTLGGKVKPTQEKIEKFATAVTGASSVLGGMGSKAGAAAGAVSNLATAFIAGGPLLAGLALVTTAASALSAAIGESIDNMHAADKAFDNFTKSMQVTSRSRIQETLATVKELDERLTTFGMGATEIQLARAESADAQARLGIENLNRSTAERRARIAIFKGRLDLAERGDVSGRAERLRAQLEDERRILESQEQRLKSRKEEQAVLDQQINLLRDLLDMEEAAKNRLGGGKGGRKTPSEYRFAGEDATAQVEALRRARGGDLAFAFFMMDDDNAEAARARKLAEDNARKAAAAKVKIAEEATKERNRIEKEAAEERRRLEEENLRATQQNAAEAIGFLSSVTSQLFTQTLDVIEQVAAGQEVAFDKLAAAFVRSIGTQIFSIGLKTTAEGLALAPTLLLPGGQVNAPSVAAHLAIGASLMGVGGGMAATGAVAQGMLSRNSGGGGGGGALAGGSLAPRGGSASGGAGGGQETVIINFNGGTQLGDPSERARLMSRDARRTARTVYTPPGGD